jgi:osmoprotectant transport system permease protein
MLEIQEASAHAAWFATLRAAFRFEFLNRPDGFPGLARRYGLRFTSAPIAMDLGLTCRALAEGRLDLIDGHSTNGLIADLHRHRLQDDRGHSPLRSRARVPRRQPELAPLP